MSEIKDIEKSTEEKIKDAARRVFHRKGFAATRTRDIAEDAGINLALLNYYFRSKQNLFDIIMKESFAGFIEAVAVIVNDRETSLVEKIAGMSCRYIDMFAVQPNLPLFIITEMRNNPEEIFSRIPMHGIIMRSYMFRQLSEMLAERGDTTNPAHFAINFMGLTVFPFVASPIIRGVGRMDDAEFAALMQQRKQLIPHWIKLILDNPMPQHESTSLPL